MTKDCLSISYPHAYFALAKCKVIEHSSVKNSSTDKYIYIYIYIYI